MKKELIETIDNTIMSTCTWINNLLSYTDSNCNEKYIYQIAPIEALAKLISARALLEKESHYFSDSSKE